MHVTLAQLGMVAVAVDATLTLRGLASSTFHASGHLSWTRQAADAGRTAVSQCTSALDRLTQRLPHTIRTVTQQQMLLESIH